MMVSSLTIASNVTATFTAGNWYYQAVANKSGAAKTNNIIQEVLRF